MGAQYGDLRGPLDKQIALLKRIEKLLGCSTCRENTTTAGANVDVPAGLQSVAILKTNATGTVTITLSDGSTYDLTTQGEGFSDAATANGKLPIYSIASGDGGEWKWHGIK